MTNLAPLLQAIVYGDSAYPSGRYTLSHGLEGLIQQGAVQGAEQAGAGLVDHLRYTAAPGDGVATAVTVLLAECVTTATDCAHTIETENASEPSKSSTAVCPSNPLTRLIALDRELSATKITESLRKASTRVGRQTLSVHKQIAPIAGLLAEYAEAVDSRLAPGNQAIALGLIHHAHGLDAPQAVGVELIGLAVGWSSAALRLRQCDHISGQAMIAETIPIIEQLAGDSTEIAKEILHTGDLTLLGRASPGLDLASAQHQFAPARLFMS